MKCTIVSIYPREIVENKPGVYPSFFTVPAGSFDKPSYFYVEDGVQYVTIPLKSERDPGRTIKMIVPADEIAKSIVEDYCNSLLGSGNGARPGLKWFPAPITDAGKKVLEEMRQAQNNWYANLVKIADDDWFKFHNHRTISDLQIMAAKTLGLEKEWAIEPQAPKLCPVCFTSVHDKAIICPSCKVVMDPEAAKKFVFAK